MSVAGESSAGFEVDVKQSTDRTTDINTGKTTKQTRSQQFSMLETAAFIDAVPATGISSTTVFNGIFHGKLARPNALAGADFELQKLSFGAESGTISAGQIAAAVKAKALLDDQVGVAVDRDIVIGAKLVALEKVINGTYAEAREAYRAARPVVAPSQDIPVVSEVAEPAAAGY